MRRSGSMAIMVGVMAVTSVVTAADEALWLRYPAISPDGSAIVFSYKGDLWKVPATGGKATPLTLHEAQDTMPIWSHDGSLIAFASDRYGNSDIWVMPADGGEPTRLTFHSADDVPTSFTPDDSAVLSSSARLDARTNVQFPHREQPELYRVAVSGGMPVQVVTTPALYATYDRTGSRLAYSDQTGLENEWRKHDTSSFTRDVWLMDVASGQHRRLTPYGVDDRSPVWGPDDQSLYFLSERSGTFNVWRMDPDRPEVAEQITTHDAHPVRFLSVSDAGDVCYAFDGALWVRPAGAADSRRLTIEAASDSRTNARQPLDVARETSEFEVSPKGGEIAFIARGEVFVTSVDHGATRRITDTPEQERSVSFSPDGRSLLYASERRGSWNLYRTDLEDDDEPNFFNATALSERPVLEIEAETFQPRFSPDGKEVAYLQDRTELKVLNLASGESRTILPANLNYSYSDGDQWYRWSPDGRSFLVTFLSPTRWSNEVGLVPASGEGELVNLTHSGYDDALPRWVLGGEAAIWFSDRYGDRRQSGWSSEYDVKLGFVTSEAWDRFHLTEAEFEQLKAKEDKAKKAKKAKDDDDESDDDESETPKVADAVTLELDGLDDRIIRLTTHSADIADAALTPDGENLLYLAKFEKGYDLWSFKHRKPEIKLVAKLNAEDVGGLMLDAKGETAFVLVDHALRKIEIKSGEVKPVALDASMELDAAAERAYLFEHTWRQIGEKFLDPGMHGVDWPAMKAYYARFLPYVTTNWDFAELLSEMLGELNASHTGSGYRPKRPDADQTAALGFFPDPEWTGDGVRIAEIIEKSPLVQEGSKIAVGTVITAIDSHAIAAGDNWYPLLNRKADEPIRLGLLDPDSGTRWQEKVKPISWREQGQLLYERWVKTRRAEVDRLSNGRLGYAHIRGMSDGPFRQVIEDVFGRELTKEAIVLDTRFNGGGNLVEPLTVFLSGVEYMKAVPRGQFVGSEPTQRWTRPSIVIQNEGNYSDAHCFPYAYQALGIGALVGMQVPGTCTAVWWEVLQEPSLYFGMPEVAWVDMDGDILENKHLDPDYQVDNDPKIEAEGRDQQLEKAVEVLLAKLDEK